MSDEHKPPTVPKILREYAKGVERMHIPTGDENRPNVFECLRMQCEAQAEDPLTLLLSGTCEGEAIRIVLDSEAPVPTMPAPAIEPNAVQMPVVLTDAAHGFAVSFHLAQRKQWVPPTTDPTTQTPIPGHYQVFHGFTATAIVPHNDERERPLTVDTQFCDDARLAMGAVISRIEDSLDAGILGFNELGALRAGI